MHFIRRDASATFKLKTRYQHFIRLTKTVNLIRFICRAIVEFNCVWDLELNSSELNSTVA